MKRFPFSSVRARLVLLVLLPVIPALGLILYTATEQRRWAAVEAQQSALRLAQSVADSQDDLFDGARQLFIALAQMPIVDGNNPEACGSVFSMLLKKNEVYTNLGLAMLTGDVVCSGIPLRKPVSFADRAWFQRVLERRDFVVSEYLFGRVSNKATVSLAYPVLDEAGKVKAVLFGGLDLISLNRVATKAQLPAGASLTVIDREGTVLVRLPDLEKWVGKSMPETTLVQTILRQGEGTAEAAGLDGVPRLYGFIPLGDDRDAYVSVGVPKDIAFATANRILLRNLVALGLITLLALLAAWLGSDLFVLRQVNSLVSATKQLGRGDLSARTGSSYGQGELGHLARSFDEMADALQARQAEAERAEKQIKEQLQQLTALREIERAITSTLDLHAILDLLLEKIDFVFPYPVITGVRLVNKETGVLEPVACRHISKEEWMAAIRAIKDYRYSFGGMAMETRAPIVISNIQTDPRTRQPEFYRKHGIVSLLAVPLIVKGHVPGVLYFYICEAHQFSNEETEFLSTLAGQAAIAIYNSQLHEKTRTQAIELERANEDLRRREEIQKLLKELSQDITLLNVDTLLKKLTEKIREFFKVDVCDVRVWDKGVWRPVVISGIEPDHLQSSSSGTARGGSRWIIENRKPLAIPDITEAQHIPGGETTRQLGVRGYLAVPLISKSGEVVGVLRALTVGPREFSQEEVDLVQQLANGAAIAIENARLYDETTRQAIENATLLAQVSQKRLQLQEANQRLSALNSVATVANRSLDVELILRNSMLKIMEVLNLQAGRSYLIDEGAHELRLVAHEGFSEDAIPPSSYKLGEGYLAKVIEIGEPIFFKDIQSDPEFSRLARKKFMLKAGYRAEFSIPLRVKNRAIGVLNFASKEAREFLPSDVDLISSIADQISIAVENASLFSEVSQKRVELEKANKVKDEFLGFVSHELKTPVNAVMGYTVMLEDGLFGEISPKQKTALEKVTAYSKDLLSMIDSLLQATRIEAGAIKLDREEVAVIDFLDELKLVYSVPLNKELALTWNYPSELPAIKTDREKLKHILQNLISNAIKYTDKGNVTISVRVKEGGSVEFTVVDTGIGIPEELLPVIFEMFRQAERSKNGLRGGVGLGLHIVKKFTELLGGTVEVESEVGKGSTFTVTMPCEVCESKVSRQVLVAGG